MNIVFEIIKIGEQDMFVGVHYNLGEIVGINYEVGVFYTDAITKSDDNMMEILDEIKADLCMKCSNEELIIETIKRAEQIMTNLTKLKP